MTAVVRVALVQMRRYVCQLLALDVYIVLCAWGWQGSSAWL